MKYDYDVCVIGSGVAGSVCAMLLAKLGHSVLLLEKNKHPRFALGESATPLTTHYFERFGKDYDIPELLPLSSFEKLDELPIEVCWGRKEYFYYLWHDKAAKTKNITYDYPEVVVQTPGIDIQYYRAELDQYLIDVAVKYGVDYKDMVNINNLEIKEDGVFIDFQKMDDDFSVKTKYVIDAGGFRSILSQLLDLRVAKDEIETPLASRTIFAHLKNIQSLESTLENADKFNDDININRWFGTQHHCFDGGWYWFIPFSNGTVSIGLSLDLDKYPVNDKIAEEEFWEITKNIPVVNNMLQDAEVVLPFIKTGRLQYESKQIVGDRWALLPAAAAGIDAWQSSGMAMSLMGVDRVVWALDNLILKENYFSRDALVHYEIALKQEQKYFSKFVHSIYKSFKHYDIFKILCLLPFPGIERYVLDGGLARPWDKNAILMNFGNPHFKYLFNEMYEKVLELSKQDTVSNEDIAYFEDMFVNRMGIYNNRDYGSAKNNNVYLRDESQMERLRLVMEV